MNANRSAVVAATALAMVVVASAAAAEEIVGVASVIDGDTLEIHGQRIRLWGVDAPESGQRCHRDGQEWRCGKDAAFALADFIGRSTVSCNRKDTDRYGRVVAVCSVGDEELNRWLVEQGWALNYGRYSKGAYAAAEKEAKARRLGIWDSAFEPPWEWRRR